MVHLRQVGGGRGAAVDVPSSIPRIRPGGAAGRVGEHDADLGVQLARAGRGTFARIRTYRDVAPALSRAFVR
jgi:hypothetical protein